MRFKGKSKLDSDVRKSIMIIDDSQSMRLMIGSYFENEFDVIYKQDGQEALNFIFEERIPDLILLDMEMPNMNGRVFLRRLRYSREFRNLPVIFISTVNSNLIINSMIKLGIVDYLVKPFKPEELIDKVNSVLKKEE